MQNKINLDYIDHPKTKVYDLLDGSFSSKCENCCHYTSTLVLDLLLKNATFRATHLFYLNDSSELINGINLLKQIFEKNNLKRPIKLLNDIQYNESKRKIGLYSISFSEDSDLLHQWITYAKESGVCLVLNGKLFKHLLLSTISETESNKEQRQKLLNGNHIDDPVSVLNNVSVSHPASKIIYKMKYDGELDAETIYKTFALLDEEDVENPTQRFAHIKWEKATNSEDSNDAKLYLLLLASLLKNKDFESEKEIRAIFLAEREGKQKMEIKYFPLSNGILRPYCEITFCDKNENPLLPLKEIVIGPSGNQQAVFDSVVHRIKYGEVNIWDYWNNKDLFEENFYNYVLGSIKRYADDTNYNISRSFSKNIFNKLKTIWEKENKKKITMCTWEKCLKRNDMLKEDNKFIFSKRSSKKIEELSDICIKIDRDNYFSSEGIWIKKSRIPYIF